MYFSISLLITFSRQMAMMEAMCLMKSVPSEGVKRVMSPLARFRLPIRRLLRSKGTSATLRRGASMPGKRGPCTAASNCPSRGDGGKAASPSAAGFGTAKPSSATACTNSNCGKALKSTPSFSITSTISSSSSSRLNVTPSRSEITGKVRKMVPISSGKVDALTISRSNAWWRHMMSWLRSTCSSRKAMRARKAWFSASRLAMRGSGGIA